MFQIKLNRDVIKYKITTDNAYKVYIRKKQFESLVKILLCTEEPNQILKYQIKHNKMYQPIVLQIHSNILRHNFSVDLNPVNVFSPFYIFTTQYSTGFRAKVYPELSQSLSWSSLRPYAKI